MRLGDRDEPWEGLWEFIGLRWDPWSELDKMMTVDPRNKPKLQPTAGSTQLLGGSPKVIT